jgi:hypothetical protein
MADDTSRRGPPDPSRINVNQDWELRYWLKELCVSEEELRRAVQTAGVMVKDVRKHLGK